MTECKNLSKPRWENYQFLWLLISFSGRTKQIFFLVIKLEPRLLSRLQPRKNNSVPTELDVSISAIVEIAAFRLERIFQPMRALKFITGHVVLTRLIIKSYSCLPPRTSINSSVDFCGLHKSIFHLKRKCGKKNI